MNVNSTTGAQTRRTIKIALGLIGAIATLWTANADVRGDTLEWQGTLVNGQGDRWLSGGKVGNWKNLTNPTSSNFQQGSSVIFGNDPNTVRNVVVTGPVQVQSMEFRNDTGPAYRFSGTHPIIVGTNSSTTAPAGSIQVNDGGTLLLSGSGTDRLSDTTPIYLNGGTIEVNGGTTGTSEILGALTLLSPVSPYTSSLNYSGSGSSSLTFSSITSSSNLTLNVFNFDPSNDRLYIGESLGTNVTINFYSGSNPLAGEQVSYSAEVVPEPSTIIAGLGVVCFLGWRERRRISALFKREQAPEVLTAS